MLNNPQNAQANSFMCFDELVRDICLYLGDDEAKHYIKTARFVIQALREVNLHSTPTIKTKKLTVGNNMAVAAPQDLDAISKVAVCCHNGELKIILNNDNLCLPDPEQVSCCDCPPVENHIGDKCKEKMHEKHSCGCQKCTFHNYTPFLDGQSFPLVNYLYGYSPKNYNGSYRYDVASGLIVFGSGCDIQVGTQIMLEYKASATTQQLQVIPRKAYQTICHYAAWKIKMNTQPSVADMERRNFMVERSVFINSFLDYTLEDIIAAFRSGYHSTVKR